MGRLQSIALVGLLGAGGAVYAEDQQPAVLEFDNRYPLGVEKYQLDHATEMTGWQITNSWYFGRQKGEDSGLTLVWQGSGKQFSLSKDGLRYTTRF